MIKTLTAVLLVGGESRRMGADKATLMIDGKLLWLRQLDTLRNLHPDELLISARVRPAWSPADIEVVLDEPQSQGPLSGLTAALKRMRSTHLLALAIDLPEMTSGHLAKLWQLARPGVGVIPQWGRYFEPLAAIYPATAVSIAASALAAGRLSLQSLIENLLEQHETCIYPISVDERSFYRNINSRDDLNRHDGARMKAPERSIELTQVTEWEDGRVRSLQDSLAAEEPLEIRVDGFPMAVTMRTPGHDLELAAGFLLTEGIIKSQEQISSIRAVTPENSVKSNRVEVELKDATFDHEELRRNFFAASSCGVCGKASINAIRLRGLPQPERGFRIDPEILCRLPEALRSKQEVFSQTGGLHAAALFDETGQLIVLREDIGRHNAVDKIAGWALQNGRLPLSQRVMLVSGRGGFEIAQKAVAMGIPILASVSAPSSLAVKLARELGLTLVGFLRGSRFIVYSCEFRCLPAQDRS
jgi:FdhD protein